MDRQRRPAHLAVGALAAVAMAAVTFAGPPLAAGTTDSKPTPVCALITTDELSVTFASEFGAGDAYSAGTGKTCGYTGTGLVRFVTVRIAHKGSAKLAFRRTLRALRTTLRDIDSPPPVVVEGLGDRAYYAMDEFLGEAYLQVLDGRTFVQVTAALTKSDDDRSVVAQPVLVALATRVLERA